MSRANIPPMSSTQSNPRLNTKMEALLSKIYGFKFLEQPLFAPHLINSLVDYYLKDKPRELFSLLMAIEYRWRLSLHVPISEENEVMGKPTNFFELAKEIGEMSDGAFAELRPDVVKTDDREFPEYELGDPPGTYTLSRDNPLWEMYEKWAKKAIEKSDVLKEAAHVWVEDHGVATGGNVPERVTAAQNTGYELGYADALKDIFAQKELVENIIILHKPGATINGRLTCFCGKRYTEDTGWAKHVRIHLWNFFKKDDENG